MSWTREFTPSFPKTARRWLFTVCEESVSTFAADRFVWPWKMSRATRCSVAVNASQPVNGFWFREAHRARRTPVP